MNNYEINKAVAEKLGLLINEDQSASLKVKVSSVIVNDIVRSYEVNFCESWADAGPIIEKYGISMIFERADDCCTAMVINRINQGGQIEADITHENKSPSVAAMLVFLEMDI